MQDMVVVLSQMVFMNSAFVLMISFKSQENCFELKNFYMHLVLSGSNAPPASELD